jgi:hypothetical protein
MNISRPINYGNSTLHPEWNSTLPITTHITEWDNILMFLEAFNKRVKEDLECRMNPASCSDRRQDHVFKSCYECKASAEAYFSSTLFQNIIHAAGSNLSSSEYLRKRTDLGVYFD